LIRDIEDFRALNPFFRIIEQGLQGLADGEHFFELLADDVVFDFIITVPDYPASLSGEGRGAPEQRLDFGKRGWRRPGA
jgi:hypothetical protein